MYSVPYADNTSVSCPVAISDAQTDYVGELAHGFSQLSAWGVTKIRQLLFWLSVPTIPTPSYYSQIFSL
jgi:hypothetical protein